MNQIEVKYKLNVLVLQDKYDFKSNRSSVASLYGNIYQLQTRYGHQLKKTPQADLQDLVYAI